MKWVWITVIVLAMVLLAVYALRKDWTVTRLPGEVETTPDTPGTIPPFLGHVWGTNLFYGEIP